MASLDNQALAQYRALKDQKKYRYVSFRIASDGRSLELAEFGERKSNYKSFVNGCPFFFASR